MAIRYEGPRDGPCMREMQDLVSRRKELSGYLERYAALVSGGAYGAILN